MRRTMCTQYLLLTAVVDEKVEHRSAVGRRRHVQQDLVVVSDELFQLGAVVDLQQRAETPQKREHVQALVSVTFDFRLAVDVSSRQQALEQGASLTDRRQLRVLGRCRQILLDKVEKTGKRSVEQSLEASLFITWTTPQPALSSVHITGLVTRNIDHMHTNNKANRAKQRRVMSNESDIEVGCVLHSIVAQNSSNFSKVCLS